MVGWLGRVFLQDGPARPSSPVAGDTLRRWRCHIQRFFYRIYAGLRIEELFSVIRGLPFRPGVGGILGTAGPPLGYPAQCLHQAGVVECQPVLLGACLLPSTSCPCSDWPLSVALTICPMGVGFQYMGS